MSSAPFQLLSPNAFLRSVQIYRQLPLEEPSLSIAACFHFYVLKLIIFLSPGCSDHLFSRKQGCRTGSAAGGGRFALPCLGPGRAHAAAPPPGGGRQSPSRRHRLRISPRFCQLTAQGWSAAAARGRYGTSGCGRSPIHAPWAGNYRGAAQGTEADGALRYLLPCAHRFIGVQVGRGPELGEAKQWLPRGLRDRSSVERGWDEG